jgi:predicted Zn-dependent protease
LAGIAAQRGDFGKQGETLSDMGVVREFSLVGPFTPFRLLNFDEATAPERDGSLASELNGPEGPLKPRTLRAPEGKFSLSGEPPEGDSFLLVADFDVETSMHAIVRSVGAAPHKLYLDGALLFESRPFEKTESIVHAEGVKLGSGTHRLMVRLARDERTSALSVSISRKDGAPSRIAFRAATGAAADWAGLSHEPAEEAFPTAAALAHALEDEAGKALAYYLSARDAMSRDRDGAKRLLAELSSFGSPAFTSLRAELSLLDKTIPSKVAKGRATRDLEAATDKDPKDAAALLTRATLALEEGRALDASEFVKRARAAHQPEGYLVALMDAKVQLALGLDAQAEQSALLALKGLPGLCEAQLLRYELARKRDAVALSDELEQQLRACPGNLARSAEHARLRGKMPEAAALFERLVSRDENNIQNAFRLADLYVAEKRFSHAIQLIQKLRQIWPRDAALCKRLADVVEFSGDAKGALALREEALLLDGGDLSLRRAVERAKTGKELLADYAINGKDAIAAYEAQRDTEDAAAVYVLDAAAIRAYPDGSMVDRIHVIQKALDSSALSEVAEVNIPAGAQVLALRTIKQNGTVLEPENIEGKDAISLPGVQVGDYVEQEFLVAHPPRGPAQPGFTASNFYYQIARQPNYWSTYTVIAPKNSRMAVDAHNVISEQPKVVGDLEVFVHEERRVPPYIPEPDSAPSPNEYLPFVSVGSGTQGNHGVVAVYADAFLERGQRSFEVEQFAHAAASGKEGLAAVQAIHAAVMHKLSGRDSGLPVSASFSLAQERGSRLWAMKAALEAVGITARVALVRTFGTDPANYLFPNEGLLPYACLRVDLPGGVQLWLDTMVRYGPFGELPEQAKGGREAWVLPEPGRPLEVVKTPPGTAPPPKEIALKLALSADGKLSGEGVETYQGMEGAQLLEALEALSPDQRNQALQSALSRYFGGANLSSVNLDLVREVGAPLVVRYQFTSPQFARIEGNKLIAPPLTFPAQLGKRFVQLGQRRTPLFIGETEHTHTTVELKLPEGYQVSSPVPRIETHSPYGHFLRHEGVSPGTVNVDETYRLDLARIPVKQYEDFSQFAGEIDLIQARDLILQQTPQASAPPPRAPSPPTGQAAPPPSSPQQ